MSTPNAPLLERLMMATFGRIMPPQVRAVLPTDLTPRDALDFKVNPILPVGSERPPRVAISDGREPAQWARRVESTYPSPQVARFIATVPGCRRMVDTNGESAVLYLDDLQEHVSRKGPAGRPLMALTLQVPQGNRSLMTLEPNPPRQLFSCRIAEQLDALLSHGATGRWAVRYRRRQPISVLWITEARWRDTYDETTAVLEGALGLPSAWKRLGEAAVELSTYPDAVELLGPRGLDVTVGWRLQKATTADPSP